MIRKLLVVSIALVAVFALASEVQAATCTLITTNLRSGSSDALTNGQVSSLLRYLQEAGYLPASTALSLGRMTFGPQSSAAIKKFQIAERLAPTGIANLGTRFRIFARSCGAGSTVPVASSSGWQAGITRLVTWNRALVRASFVELSLKKIDTSERFILAAVTPNDGSETVVLSSSLQSGVYDLEVRFALTFGGRNYALGYPATASRMLNVTASSYRGGGGGGSGGGESTADREAREAREAAARQGSPLFSSMSAPSTLISGSTGTLTMNGTGIARYDVTFNCVGFGTYANNPTSAEHYCSSIRALNNLGPISISGTSGSFPFLVSLSSGVSTNKTITVTVRAYQSNGALLLERSAIVTVTPYTAAPPPPPPPPPDITVLSPDVSGSTNWVEGDNQTIRWSFSDASTYPVSVTIVRCANGTVPCSTSGQSSYFLSSSFSRNSQTWKVGNYLNGTSMGLSNGYYLVRVCHTASPSTCSGGLVNVIGVVVPQSPLP